ncbi:MAG: hypothetical protein ACREJT_10610 [Myxococcota bacterium]
MSDLHTGATLLILLAAVACGGRSEAARPTRDSARASASAYPDSLAYQAPNVEVWYTAGRPAVAADGHACVERVMEIRRDGRRIAVPLLYTGERPARVNDSTIAAHIWLNCVPGNRYHVNLRTGQPTYLGKR